MLRKLITFALLLISLHTMAQERQRLNFNADWLLSIGDHSGAEQPEYADSTWKHVTLPRAFNQEEAFARDIVDLTDTIVWYRKHFILPQQNAAHYFIEFEGVRQGAEFFINGHSIGWSENGVMACGFDLTPYIVEGDNVIAVRIDNSWNYHERETGSRFQWNDKNFNANYGGIPKNVFLHITGPLYQTLPLYSNLGTTGTYIYATDIDVADHRAVINAEAEVHNEGNGVRTFALLVQVIDNEGNEITTFKGSEITVPAGGKAVAKASQTVGDLHFWSWGYGYIYNVKTSLIDTDGQVFDTVLTRTGFRKTEFKDGKIWLNDRVLMVHGYAQRTSNEWPALGMSVPAWLSDYSNSLMVESGGNLVRWMHVTPWKQDIESCDRVGLLQAMPAGDAEKDVDDIRWQQRLNLMRDAIIYNRNNPSIIFYECGNESISREHMIEMKALRDLYDPYGGRAIGSREMLDIDEAEYGGEMLYINKSAQKPLWAMEYCRDEGLRKYWDEKSYPFHKEGDGPLYRDKPALEYNHNMDEFAAEMVRRWYDYWMERPGTGTRVSSGGVKIVFSDTNTHHRGESNYRTSGVVDAMRLPKDAFFAHQVMWTGWVEDEKPMTYIVGHWNYEEGTSGLRKYVVSNADEVELFLNGKSLGKGTRSYNYLFTFENLTWEFGELVAVGRKDGHEVSRYKLETIGWPAELHLTAIGNPLGFKADGQDVALVDIEVTDAAGRRCPLDNRMLHISVEGQGEYLGGIASQKGRNDNFVLSDSLPVECGINRIMVRSTTEAGDIRITVSAEGLPDATLTLTTTPSSLIPPPSSLKRGETPLSPSYTDTKTGIRICNVTAGSNQADALLSIDDNELSEWRSDGTVENAWITYTFDRKTVVDEIVMKLTGWRSKCYPLAVYAGSKLLWEGITPASLGYVHIPLDKKVKTRSITLHMIAPAQDSSAFSTTGELAGGAANDMDRIRSQKGKTELRIVEAEFLKALK